MTFGLTPQGYNRKKLADIKTEMEAAFKAAIGVVTISPDSVIGQIIGVISKVAADLYENNEDVYFSQYTSTAEGIALDYANKNRGVDRLLATRTTVRVGMTGSEGVSIPVTTRLSVIGTGAQFKPVEESIVTHTKAISATIVVATVTSSTTYTIIIDGAGYEIVSDSSATAAEIAAAFVSLINGEGLDILATNNGNGIFTLSSTNLPEDFSLGVDEKLIVSTRTTSVIFEAVDLGATPVPLNSLTNIVTSITGLESVTNFEAGVTGREVETDAESRQRGDKSVRIIGAGSVEAIRARILQEVDSIEFCKVYDNRKMVIVNGIPPKTFEAVVVGGDTQAIINKIWEVGAAGIDTYGNTSGFAVDSAGDLQPIYFTRPEDLHVWIKVVLTVNSNFPANGLALVRDAIASKGSSYGVGEDVILQAFFCGIFNATPNAIDNITLTAAAQNTLTPAPSSGAYSASNIAVGVRQISKFASNRIQVTIA